MKTNASMVFRMAFRNLTREKVRSFLTLLGVFIGMSAVFALLTISTGLRFFVQDQLEQLGEEVIFVSLAGSYGPNTGQLSEESGFDDSDVSEIESVQGVERAWRNFRSQKNVEFRDESLVITITGIEQDGIDVLNSKELLTALEGRLLRKNDLHSAMVSEPLAKEAFDKEIRIGSEILIDDEPFDVVGIVDFQSGPFGGNPVIVSKDAFEEIFGVSRARGITLVSSDEPSVMERRLSEKLDRMVGEESYEVVTGEDRAQVVNNVIGLLEAVLGGVAAISLLIGVLGITNTMYMSITEKRREIGIMKAIGADKKTVVGIFTLESGLLGLLGGAIGSILGFFMAKLVEGLVRGYVGENFSIVLSVTLVVQVLLFSFFLGVFAGLIPVRQALKLKPVEAMR